MALENVITSLVLDVIDHDQTQAVVKSIALDSKTRYVQATIVQHGLDYDVDPNAVVTLTIIRPDNVGVQITGSVVDVDNADRTGTIKGVYAELSQAALAKSGTLKAQFKLTVGQQILRTEIFQVKNGIALDGETSEWADQYQGYNLDELVESVNSAVATVNAMESDVSDLKEGLTDVNGHLTNIVDSFQIDLTYQYIVGYRVATGDVGATAILTPSANASFAYLIVNCKENDEFVITGAAGTTYRAWAFIDQSNKVLSASGLSESDATIIAPQNTVKLVINAKTESNYKLIKKSVKIKDIDNSVEGLLKLCGLTEEITFTNDHYIDNSADNITSAVASPSASNLWKYAIVPCSEGDAFFLNCNSGTKPKAYTFVNANYDVLLRKNNATVGETVIAPHNSAYLVINALKTNPSASYFGNNKIEANENSRNYYNENLVLTGKNNMVWSWWVYPQVISFKRARNKVYWGYTTADGFIGVAEYNIDTGETIKNHLRKSTQIDDHNASAVYVYDDGTVLCAYASGHSQDYYIRVRTSEVAESVERFGQEILLPSAGFTSYTQLLFYGDKLYVFYRSGFYRSGINNWAYRYTDDKGETWSDETILITSDVQYYCKFMYTTTEGVIRICMCSNPSLSDANIRQAFFHADTGTVYDSDDATILGTSSISKDNISVLIPIDANYSTQRLLDVAVTDINKPLILYAPFSTGSDSIYRIYDNGAIVNVITGGIPLIASYLLGASWIGSNKIIASYGGPGMDNIAILDYINGAITINETLRAETRGNIPIRNARPIADVNNKCVLWQRGYYGSTFTEFNMDAELHMLTQN